MVLPKHTFYAGQYLCVPAPAPYVKSMYYMDPWTCPPRYFIGRVTRA